MTSIITCVLGWLDTTSGDDITGLYMDILCRGLLTGTSCDVNDDSTATIANMSWAMFLVNGYILVKQNKAEKFTIENEGKWWERFFHLSKIQVHEKRTHFPLGFYFGRGEYPKHVFFFKKKKVMGWSKRSGEKKIDTERSKKTRTKKKSRVVPMN